MKIIFISMICLVLAVVQMVQCEAVFEPTESQDIDETDLILKTKTVMDPTQNNETKLVRHRRGQCCSGSNTRCCCKVHGFECVVKGIGHACYLIQGAWDCEGCRLGWKC